MRVLVVEDEPLMAETVAMGLRGEGMAVDVVDNGADALERAAVNAYDVIVLDRDIPVINGDTVCRSLVASGAEPRVIMLTAARTMDDMVDGLGLGADDYLTKPFRFPELVARLRALHRRRRVSERPVLEYAGVRIDPHLHRVLRDGRPVRLRRKEFAVLTVLVTARGEVVPPESLLAEAWDEHAAPGASALRATVWSLRRKLGSPDLIHTEINLGYRLARL